MYRVAVLLPALLIAAPARADDRAYMLTDFDAVRVEGPYEVTVATGRAPRAVASGAARSFETVDVRVENRTLVVRAGLEAWGGYPGAKAAAPRIAVTVPAVRTANVTGGGRLTIDRMAGQTVTLQLLGAGSIAVGAAKADRLEAGVVGAGTITLGGTAQRARLIANGAGSIDAAGLTADALFVDWQSVGSARVTARYTAEVYARGQGPVEVLGKAACKVAGAGPVSCSNIASRRD
ncbi:GIN domain-containing protein [Sphingomonas floccifaciens]